MVIPLPISDKLSVSGGSTAFTALILPPPLLIGHCNLQSAALRLLLPPCHRRLSTKGDQRPRLPTCENGCCHLPAAYIRGTQALLSIIGRRGIDPRGIVLSIRRLARPATHEDSRHVFNGQRARSRESSKSSQESGLTEQVSSRHL